MVDRLLADGSAASTARNAIRCQHGIYAAGTRFLPMNDRAACRYMKMITPAKLLHTLRTGDGAVDVDPETAARARRAVEAMIAIGEPGRGGE